ELLFIDQRANVCVGIQAVAETQLPGLLHACFKKGVMYLSRNVAAFYRKAGLPGVDERTPNRSAGSDIDVCVIEYKHRIFAAEFKHHRQQAVGSLLSNSLPGREATGEDEFVDSRLNQGGARKAEAGYNLKNTFWNSCATHQR